MIKVPKVGDTILDEGNMLRVTRVFKSNLNVVLVEYIDRNNLHGCVIPEYWYKKAQLDRQAGSGAPS